MRRQHFATDHLKMTGRSRRDMDHALIAG